MKKLLLFSVALFCIQSFVQAQDDDDNGSSGKVSVMQKKDRLIIEIFSDVWQDKPADIKFKNLQRGVNTYLMYDFPFANSPISWAFGFGIGTHNIYTNGMPLQEFDSTGKLTGNTIFAKFDNKTYFANQRNIDYKNNKFAVSYLDLPLEVRFRTKNANKNKIFKFTVGFKGGFLLNNHIKFKGDDFVMGTDTDIKYKQHLIKNIEKSRYGFTARVGYGMFNAFGYYSLSKLFKDGKGPEMYPISVGIAIIPF